MLIQELFENYSGELDATATAIATIASQLQQAVKDQKIPVDDFSVDDLLDYFQSYDIILDVNDLYTMIQTDPMKRVISNIQGDDVIFKGHQKSSVDAPEGEAEKVVSQMAARAMKK